MDDGVQGSTVDKKPTAMASSSARRPGGGRDGETSRKERRGEGGRNLPCVILDVKPCSLGQRALRGLCFRGGAGSSRDAGHVCTEASTSCCVSVRFLRMYVCIHTDTAADGEPEPEPADFGRRDGHSAHAIHPPASSGPRALLVRFALLRTIRQEPTALGSAVWTSVRLHRQTDGRTDGPIGGGGFGIVHTHALAPRRRLFLFLFFFFFFFFFLLFCFFFFLFLTGERRRRPRREMVT